MTKKRTIDLVGRFADHLARKSSSPSPNLGSQASAVTAAATPGLVADVADTGTAIPTAAINGNDSIRSDSSPDILRLDLTQLRKEGFVTPQNQRALIAEEYRIIKRPLLRGAFDPQAEPGECGHVVMVTSPRPGEGKTFTSINLAMSVASERDLFVLLIDCDIRQRGLTTKLGLMERKGLMDILLNPSIPLSDVIVRTDISNLSIIPSGQHVEAATEMFASQRMAQLVHDIAGRYRDRFIIFDAPPVLASSEPGVLASHVGQIVMVVRANETSCRAVAEAMPLINTCPRISFVLNGASMAAGHDRFGQYGVY